MSPMSSLVRTEKTSWGKHKPTPKILKSDSWIRHCGGEKNVTTPHCGPTTTKKYLLLLCAKNFRAQRENFFFYKKILRFKNQKNPDFSGI